MHYVSGYIDVIEILIDLGYSLTEKSWIAAFNSDHVELYEFLRSQECPVTDAVIRHAIDLAVMRKPAPLTFLKENAYPILENKALMTYMLNALTAHEY